MTSNSKRTRFHFVPLHGFHLEILWSGPWYRFWFSWWIDFFENCILNVSVQNLKWKVILNFSLESELILWLSVQHLNWKYIFGFQFRIWTEKCGFQFRIWTENVFLVFSSESELKLWLSVQNLNWKWNICFQFRIWTEKFIYVFGIVFDFDCEFSEKNKTNGIQIYIGVETLFPRLMVHCHVFTYLFVFRFEMDKWIFAIFMGSITTAFQKHFWIVKVYHILVWKMVQSKNTYRTIQHGWHWVPKKNKNLWNRNAPVSLGNKYNVPNSNPKHWVLMKPKKALSAQRNKPAMLPP